MQTSRTTERLLDAHLAFARDVFLTPLLTSSGDRFRVIKSKSQISNAKIESLI